MTEFDRTSTSQEYLSEKSLAWVNLLLSGAMTPADAQALNLWRARSPAHEQAFADAVRFQRAVRRSILSDRENASAAPSPVQLAQAQRHKPVIGRRVLLGGAVAASAAAYLAIKPPGELWPSLAELMSDYHTGTGEQRKIALASGVSLELNTRTNVSLQRSGGAPAVKLVSGEATATVRRPASAPFTILAGAGRTLLAQARVDVRKDGPTVCVTCMEGSADVAHSAGRVRLEAGRQVTYTDNAMGRPIAVDVAVLTAWRSGLLIFRDAPLQHVVDELNRYRAGKIILLDAQLGSRPVYGVFQIARIADAAEQLRRLTGAKLTSLPGDIVVLS